MNKLSSIQKGGEEMGGYYISAAREKARDAVTAFLRKNPGADSTWLKRVLYPAYGEAHVRGVIRSMLRDGTITAVKEPYRSSRYTLTE
jgi:hypothetical protein